MTESNANTKLVYVLAALVLVVAAAATWTSFYMTYHLQPAVFSSKNFSHIDNETPSGSSLNDCVAALSPENLQVTSVPCGSPESTYRIVQRVANSSECPADSDLKYSWGSAPVAGALCLDYDWTADSCIRIEPDYAVKEKCLTGSSTTQSVRPELVVTGTSEMKYCRIGGIPHPIRKFTVCTVPGQK
ncbi:LppU/SCO3897 family protein [Mycobacteroides abscessus]|uniref:LppU/SCO3897 family protein n=1 Tax=Mycobacteroides abscessus TaxID=36809 RepID=UPI003B43A191